MSEVDFDFTGMPSTLKPLMASQRHSWETPEDLLELVRKLGPIDLDPCTSHENPCQAGVHLAHGGLDTGWRDQLGRGGYVYCNPPYGRAVGDWVQKCITESFRDMEIVLLTAARPDTDWYDRARRSCSAWCEIKGRLKFRGAQHPAPFPSTIHYWGPRPYLFCHWFQAIGRVGVR